MQDGALCGGLSDPELHAPLERHMLVHLTAADLARLSRTCKVLQSWLKQVDITVWQRAAARVLPSTHPALTNSSIPLQRALQDYTTAQCNIRAGKPTSWEKPFAEMNLYRAVTCPSLATLAAVLEYPGAGHGLSDHDTVVILCGESGSVKHELVCDGAVVSLAFSRCSTHLTVLTQLPGSDWRARALSATSFAVASGRVEWDRTMHVGQEAVELSPHAACLTVSVGRDMQITDTHTGQLILSVSHMKSDVVWQPEEQLIACQYGEHASGCFEVQDVRSGGRVYALPGPPHMKPFAWSGDSKYIACHKYVSSQDWSSGSSRSTQVFTVIIEPDGTEKLAYEGACDISFSVHSAYAALCNAGSGTSGTCLIWDLQNASPVGEICPFDGSSKVGFSPDERIVHSCDTHSSVVMFETSAVNFLSSICMQEEAASRLVAWSPTGCCMLSITGASVTWVSFVSNETHATSPIDDET